MRSAPLSKPPGLSSFPRTAEVRGFACAPPKHEYKPEKQPRDAPPLRGPVVLFVLFASAHAGLASAGEPKDTQPSGEIFSKDSTIQRRASYFVNHLLTYAITQA